MHITINGKSEELPAGTVADVLTHKAVDPHMVAVELNARIIERTQFDTTAVKDGDAVELLFYMGGGS